MDITLTFTEEEWKTILEAEGDDCGEFAEGVRDRIINALCPNGGHEETVEIWDQGHSGSYFGIYKIYMGICKRCGTRLWRIEPRWTGFKQNGSYNYIDWLGEGWPGIDFTPGDENDPRKVEFNGKGSD